MNSFRELFSDEEKSGVVEFLRLRKNDQWNSKHLDLFWHTSRILQSITHLALEKKIFIHNVYKNRVIVGNFAITNKTIVEHYEIWVDENISSDELILVCESLLEIFEHNEKLGNISFVLTIPKIVKETLLKEYSKYKINLAFNVDVDSYFYNISNENHLQSRTGFDMKSIPVENTEIVLKNWKYGAITDYEWIRQSIKDFPSFGIWDVASNEMVAQFIYMNTGLFGNIYVDTKYRGTGLSKLLVQGMIEKVKSRNMEMIIAIEPDNIVSKRLFEKLNFQQVTSSTYIVFAKDNIINTGTDF